MSKLLGTFIDIMLLLIGFALFYTQGESINAQANKNLDIPTKNKKLGKIALTS